MLAWLVSILSFALCISVEYPNGVVVYSAQPYTIIWDNTDFASCTPIIDIYNAQWNLLEQYTAAVGQTSYAVSSFLPNMAPGAYYVLLHMCTASSYSPFYLADTDAPFIRYPNEHVVISGEEYQFVWLNANSSCVPNIEVHDSSGNLYLNVTAAAGDTTYTVSSFLSGASPGTYYATIYECGLSYTSRFYIQSQGKLSIYYPSGQTVASDAYMPIRWANDGSSCTIDIAIKNSSGDTVLSTTAVSSSTATTAYPLLPGAAAGTYTITLTQCGQTATSVFYVSGTTVAPSIQSPSNNTVTAGNSTLFLWSSTGQSCPSYITVYDDSNTTVASWEVAEGAQEYTASNFLRHSPPGQYHWTLSSCDQNTTTTFTLVNPYGKLVVSQDVVTFSGLTTVTETFTGGSSLFVGTTTTDLYLTLSYDYDFNTTVTTTSTGAVVA